MGVATSMRWMVLTGSSPPSKPSPIEGEGWGVDGMWSDEKRFVDALASRSDSLCSLFERSKSIWGGDFDEVDGVGGEGIGEGAGEFIQIVDAGGGGAVGFGELDEVGVA